MDNDAWQKLLVLENHDGVGALFEKLHGLKLNSKRTTEINASARQAKEYFRNAATSDFSVRPLLTFYGVNSLSRALTLLCLRTGGECSLKQSHGLRTVGWSQVFAADNANFAALRVESEAGLFTDLLTQTKNRMCIHIQSSKVDGRISYDLPTPNLAVTLGDLLERHPDLSRVYAEAGGTIKNAQVHSVSNSPKTGFNLVMPKNKDAQFVQEFYVSKGFAILQEPDYLRITAPYEFVRKEFPQLVHTYHDKVFEKIPDLYVALQLPNDVGLSQIGLTYVVSYYLGMLVRYHPTQWMGLIQGAKGDLLWPTLRKAQAAVEKAYPELIAEFVGDLRDHGLNVQEQG